MAGRRQWAVGGGAVRWSSEEQRTSSSDSQSAFSRPHSATQDMSAAAPSRANANAASFGSVRGTHYWTEATRTPLGPTRCRLSDTLRPEEVPPLPCYLAAWWDLHEAGGPPMRAEAPKRQMHWLLHGAFSDSIRISLPPGERKGDTPALHAYHQWVDGKHYIIRPDSFPVGASGTYLVDFSAPGGPTVNGVAVPPHACPEEEVTAAAAAAAAAPIAPAPPPPPAPAPVGPTQASMNTTAVFAAVGRGARMHFSPGALEWLHQAGLHAEVTENGTQILKKTV